MVFGFKIYVNIVRSIRDEKLTYHYHSIIFLTSWYLPLPHIQGVYATGSAISPTKQASYERSTHFLSALGSSACTREQVVCFQYAGAAREMDLRQILGNEAVLQTYAREAQVPFEVKDWSKVSFLLKEYATLGHKVRHHGKAHVGLPAANCRGAEGKWTSGGIAVLALGQNRGFFLKSDLRQGPKAFGRSCLQRQKLWSSDGATC